MRLLFLLGLLSISCLAQDKRPRESGIEIGILPTGKTNSITDVQGVTVGHVTLIKADSIRTGVTALLPHDGNIYQQKVPAAIYIGNGFGKLTGYSQVEELGNLETPVILTNTLSVSTAMEALVDFTLHQPGNEDVRSVNAVVGETNDGYLNDIRGRHVTQADVREAIRKASSGIVEEGSVGAGTGTVCFGFKGGIGTSSRKLPKDLGGYTVGVLAQTNFGGVLQIDGVPVGVELGEYAFQKSVAGTADGSCIMVVATDAPLDSRNLKRLAMRAILGLGKTGGIASNGSGDYVIAFSTAPELQIEHTSKEKLYAAAVLRNDEMSPLFLAVIEATEEAIINSLFAAQDMTGVNGHQVEELPVDKVLELMRKYNRLRK